MTRKFLRLVLFLFISLTIFSCKSAPKTPSDSRGQPAGREQQQIAGSLAEEIRGLVETGYLSSLTQALELIRGRELGGTDFGRVMNGIIIVLIRLVYPDSPALLPVMDLPQTYSYANIIREAERGNYIHPADNSVDFFEYVLPFLAINDKTTPEILESSLADLKKAAELRPSSVLPHFFQGLLYERGKKYAEADAAYRQAHSISNECYPALANSARMKGLLGRKNEEAAIFSELSIQYPDSLLIKRMIAITYYENKDWSRAGPAVDEILQREPRDGEFLLMKASLLIEQGHFPQANAPLDTYASINANNRLYLFLRARVQAEGSRNNDSALNYLRSIIRTNPNDEEALIYAARLLMESQRPADQTEGREYLERLRQSSGSSVAVLSLSLRDAVQRESWQEAQGYLNRILVSRRTVQDITDGYYIERGLRNNSRALSFARELYEKDTANNEYAGIYISALVDNGRRDEASRLIESRLSSSSSGTDKSRIYFLRSRIQSNEDAVLGDLRSSLFEDPRNLDAIIAMFEIYHQRREERRAVYYLRQGLAISPDNPRLKRYEKEYSALLGRN